MRTLALIVALVLAGCSSIDKKVEGFPQDLKIEYKVVTPGEVFSHCWQYLTTLQKVLLSIPLACAEIDLDTRTCTIIHHENTGEWVMEHEVGHCRGGDHDGILQAYFDEWKAKK